MSGDLDSGIKKAGLLGTVFTMREAFYRNGLARYGIDVLVPSEDAQETMNRVIFDELCRGEVRQPSRGIFLEIVKSLADAGAEAIILGCTEIPLLVRPEDTSLPLFNTTVLHARKALDYAIVET